MAMMVSIQRRLNMRTDEDRDRQFLAHTLQYLTTSSGRQVEIDDWMITSYEVEFGHEIGSGGLYDFFVISQCVPAESCVVGSGQVFKGSWNRADVALKVLVMEDGVTPSSKVRSAIPFSWFSRYSFWIAVYPRRDPSELTHAYKFRLYLDCDQIWSKIRHPNILREFAARPSCNIRV